MESLYDESQVVKELIQPLELFLCGSPSADTDKIWEDLSKNDNPPALCGRVFRMGEPTYRWSDTFIELIHPTVSLTTEQFV